MFACGGPTAAFVGDRGAHREAFRQRRRLRGAVEPPVDGEIGRHRNIGLLDAGQPCTFLDQTRERAGIPGLAGLVQRRARDRIGARQEFPLRLVDRAAQRGEQRSTVGPFDLRRGLWSAHRRDRPAAYRAPATPARLTPALASRSPISEPGRGVLAISLSGSVVRIHSETRFDSAVAKMGAPSRADQQQRVRPVRREAGDVGDRARLRVVGVEHEGVEAGALHRGAQP